MKTYENGVIGTFPGYPVYEQLAELAPFFRQKQKVWHSGWRQKFEMELDLDGLKTPFIVKAKVESTDEELKKHQSNFAKYRLWRARLREVSPDSPNAAWLREQIREFSKEVQFNSVVREMEMAEVAAQRYRAVYGEQLEIEKGAGFVIQNDGRKWSVYQRIMNVINFSEFSYKNGAKVEARADEYIKKMVARLQNVGIQPKDLMDRKMANVLITGDREDIEGLKFVLIDTEDWKMAA